MIKGDVIPAGALTNYVEWSIEDIPLLAADSIEVHRSNSEEGDFYIINSFDINTMSFLDEGINNESYGRTYFYKVFLVRGGEVIDESPLLSQYHTKEGRDFQAEMINRAATIGYDGLFGSKVYVLKRKTWGPKCSCIDPIRDLGAKTSCKGCYGSGFIGGFHSPILTRSHNNPRVKRTVYQLFDMEPEDVMMKFLTYPVMKSGDIIVDSNNDRYVAITVRVSKKLDILVSQLVQTRRKTSRSDHVYDYDLDVRLLRPDNYLQWEPL